MATINGAAAVGSGTRSTYTISTGIPGDWSITSGTANGEIMSAATGVTSVSIRFKDIGSFNIRYVGPTTVNRSVTSLSITITGDTSINSGTIKPYSLDNSGGQWASVTWNSAAPAAGTLVDGTDTPIASDTSFNIRAKALGLGPQMQLRAVAIPTVGTDEAYGLKIVPVVSIPIAATGFTIVQAANVISGDAINFSIDPSDDPFYASNTDPNAVRSQGQWSIIGAASFTTSSVGVSSVTVKAGVLPVGGAFQIKYDATTGGAGIRSVNLIPITITPVTTVSLFSGSEYDFTVDSLKYTSGGSWTLNPIVGSIISSTANTIHIKAQGGTSGTQKGTGSGFIDYTAANGGYGRLFLTVSRIPITGTLSPLTGAANVYTAVGYTGGTWTTVHANVVIQNANTNQATVYFFQMGANQVIGYDATNQGYGAVIVTPAFNIWGNYVGAPLTDIVNDIYVTDPSRNPLIARFPIETLANSGTWSTTTPSIISVVQGNQSNPQTLRTATVTGLLPGVGVVRYFNNNTSTMYTFNVNVITPPPVAVDDSLTVNDTVGGSVNLITNDDLGGRTLTSIQLTSYGTLNPIYASLTGTTLNISSGAPVGSYILKYTITTDYGTSSEANINLTVTAGILPPVAVDDNMNVDNNLGGSLDLTLNDNLNGRPFQSMNIVGYGTLNPIYVSTTGSTLNILTGAPVGNYVLVYNISTDGGTSNNANVNLTVFQSGSPPVVSNANNVAQEVSEDPIVYDISGDVQTNGGTISNIDIIDLIRTTDTTGPESLPYSGIVVPSVGPPVITVNPGLDPGDYEVQYTVDTEYGTSNVGNITFEVTSQSINNINGTFESNGLDLTSVTLNQTTMNNLLFVRDAALTKEEIKDAAFSEYVEGKNMTEDEKIQLRERLDLYSDRTIEMFRKAGEDVFDRASLIKKRRISLLAEPSDKTVTTMKISYDNDNL